jgi:hypothetical protein
MPSSCGESCGSPRGATDPCGESSGSPGAQISRAERVAAVSGPKNYRKSLRIDWKGPRTTASLSGMPDVGPWTTGSLSGMPDAAHHPRPGAADPMIREPAGASQTAHPHHPWPIRHCLNHRHTCRCQPGPPTHSPRPGGADPMIRELAVTAQAVQPPGPCGTGWPGAGGLVRGAGAGVADRLGGVVEAGLGRGHGRFWQRGALGEALDQPAHTRISQSGRLGRPRPCPAGRVAVQAGRSRLRHGLHLGMGSCPSPSLFTEGLIEARRVGLVTPGRARYRVRNTGGVA